MAQATVGTTSTRVSFQRRPIDVIVCAIGLVVLFICAVLVRNGTAGPTEQDVFRWINGLPEILSSSMKVTQLLGILVIGPIVAVGAAALRRWRLALAAVIVTVGKLAAERMVWHVVQRSRPGTTIPGAIVRGSTPATGLAFVSGHVVLVTGLAWALTPYLRGWWRILPWTVVVLVSFARLYLGAHAPLDIVGGVGLGLFIGGSANLIVGVESGTGAGRHRDPSRR